MTTTDTDGAAAGDRTANSRAADDHMADDRMADDRMADDQTVDDSATGHTATTGMDPLFGPGLRVTGAELAPAVGFWSMVRTLPRLVALTTRLAWRADRAAVLVVMVAEFVGGIAAALVLVTTNQVLQALLAGGEITDRLTNALPAVTLLAVVTGSAALARCLSAAASGRLGPRVDRVTYTELLHRAARVELATIDQAGFHDMMSSARRGAMAARQVTDCAIRLTNGVLGLAFISGVLGSLHPLLLPLLVATVVPRGWGSMLTARARYTSIRSWLEVSRKLDMLAALMIDRGSAEEIRVHDAAPFLLEQYRRLAASAEAEQGRLARIEARLGVIGAGLSGLASVVTYAALVGLLAAGAVPLSAAGTAALAIVTASARLRMLVDTVDDTYEHGLFVLDWQRACTECERHAMPAGGVPAPPPTTISASGLRFTYPGASRPALDRVDLTLRRGEVVALVGENGSGKSTLARLLVGLYLPQEGQVCWDGTPLDRLRRDTVFDHASMVAQEFVQWPFTARVNVGIGRWAAIDDDARLAAAAAACGVDGLVHDLPLGWDTLLAREFWGGTSLSGGQWQRVALARAWFRDAPILVFDEPTSALDPLAEAAAFDRVAELADRGRTILLITHRLASVRRADRIYVLADGRVAEHGTHEDLLARGAAYATMYRTQAQQYG